MPAPFLSLRSLRFARPRRVAAGLLAAMGLLTGGALLRADGTTEREASGVNIASAPVTITVENLPQPGEVTIDALAKREVVQAFLAQNPDLRIKSFAMPAIGVDDARDSGSLMAIAAGMGANAIYVNFRQSATYNEHGFLQPLETLLARQLSADPAVRQTGKDGDWLADPAPEEVATALELIRQRVPERAWPVVYREDMSGRFAGKHVWTLPTSTLVRALFYRKDHFQAAGLDPARPPATWDELLAACRQLHDPAQRRYAMAFSPGDGISYQAYQFLVNGDTRAMTQDADGQWRASFATPGAAEGVRFFWRLLREPYTRDGETFNGAAVLRPDFNNLWKRGLVSMSFGSLDDQMLAAINPQLVGIAPLPVGPDGQRGSLLNARMLGVFSQGSPAQQLAAMRYLWFVTGEEAQAIRTRLFVDRGYGAFVSPELLRKFGYGRLLENVPPGWAQTYAEALAGGVPEPYGRGTQFIYRMLSMPVNQALERDYTGLSAEAAEADILALLRAAEEEVNARALGRIAPEKLRERRQVAGCVLAVLAAAFTVGIGAVWRSFGRVGPAVDLSHRRHRRNLLRGWVLLLPAFGLILVWQYLPLILGGATITFMDYELVLPSRWVGVDNFATILYDPRFWDALWREFYFVALMIGLGFWPPILLAILLQEVPTTFAKYFFRTVYYLPSVLAGVVVMFLWLQMYDPAPSGTLNQLLLALNQLGSVPATLVKWLLLGCWLALIALLVVLPAKLEEMPTGLKLCLWGLGLAFIAVTLAPLGEALRAGGPGEAAAVLGSLSGRFQIEPQRWLQDPRMAMLCIIIPSVWAASGPGCIIYLAGLKSIPDELYEAAAIDGAGFWHKVFYITLPRMKFLIVINLIAALVAAFKGGADQILIMTGGGPNEATRTLSLAIFYRTFMDLDYGVGTAMAWIMGGILIGFTAYQMRLLARAEFKSGASGN
ncbi:extracellular solute-binding protein [Ruficoccus amylovorans]|uniref:Extracellular solute-binding protein n=1 Tax=Ruficoccus amylovorans TaxID=1804625 RepID=A0A842HCM4_9BACT|nr:extracellular solute-binding protein [Ruficoccus amylovorans]MBC2593357.1 extracellular solute-binding protein [Ruficoccus amylovorans]